MKKTTLACALTLTAMSHNSAYADDALRFSFVDQEQALLINYNWEFSEVSTKKAWWWFQYSDIGRISAGLTSDYEQTSDYSVEWGKQKGSGATLGISRLYDIGNIGGFYLLDRVELVYRDFVNEYDKNDGFSYMVSGGAAYELNRNFALDLTIGYGSYLYKEKHTVLSTTFEFRF